MKTKTLLDEYNFNISPKLKEIDIYLKSEKEPFNIEKTAKLLNISKEELIKIMDIYDIENINLSNFFIIMKNGSSYICRLISRKINCPNYEKYSPEIISYIYNIELEKVYTACQKINCYIFNEKTIKNIFSEIKIQSDV